MSGGREPSHHLLRTLAAVAPGARVLLLEDEPCHGWALEALGFDVASGPAGQAAHDWAVVWSPHRDREELARLVRSARRALVPGGWVWVGTAAVGDPTQLSEIAEEAGLALSEAPAFDRVGDVDAVRGVFRRTGAGSVA